VRLSNLPFIKILNAHIIDYPTPSNINYIWSFGSLAGLYLFLQIITGILLVMFYTPQSFLAFNSIEYIIRDINNGWLFKYLHANIASFFFIFVYIHLLRGLYFKSYFNPRKILWYTGLIIFFLIMATAFIGYVLPWGQISFWGATVITNLFSAIPVFGKNIAQWLWGGYAIDNATLGRFFSLHYLLPFLISIFAIIHLYFLHIYGSNTPLGLNNMYDKITFMPYFYVKDFFILVVSFVIFSFVCFFLPNILGHPDNYIIANPLVTPTHIVPEWYFLYFYAILRSIPNKLGGVVCIASAIVILFCISWLQTSLCIKKSIRFIQIKLHYKIFYFISLANVLILGWIGAQPIEFPFVFIGIFSTIFYFFSLSIGFFSLFLYDSSLYYDSYNDESDLNNIYFYKSYHLV
jgi:quinol-cytochrome oxidoreductase complex cytochrome b subunit